jgi:hypothetical protein
MIVAAAVAATIVIALRLFPRLAGNEGPTAVPSATAPPSTTMGGPTPSESAVPRDGAAEAEADAEAGGDKPGKKIVVPVKP